ncbi:MAG: response regulator [Gammaproteobacteria bacterium]|nr:response regulator [Gammaproteobacteria bacterium]
MDKRTVLITCEEKLDHQFSSLLRNESLNIMFVPDYHELAIFANKIKPNIILLSATFNKDEALRTCALLKKEEGTKNIPVLFVSADGSSNARYEAYTHGANDFLLIPFSSEELLAKTEIGLHHTSFVKNIEKQLDLTRETAMEALTSQGELGSVLQFFTQSFRCSSIEDLAKQIVNVTSQYSLDCLVRISHRYQEYICASQGEPTDTDIKAMNALKGAERIVDYRSRTVFNFENCSLLIKNMPQGDANFYGRLKDNLVLLVEGAHARAQSIESEIAMRAQKKVLQTLIKNASTTLADIDREFYEHKVKNSEILDTLSQKIEEAFISLGLTDDQEERLMGLVNEASEQSQALYEKGLELDKRIKSLTSILHKGIHKSSSRRIA